MIATNNNQNGLLLKGTFHCSGKNCDECSRRVKVEIFGSRPNVAVISVSGSHVRISENPTNLTMSGFLRNFIAMRIANSTPAQVLSDIVNMRNLPDFICPPFRFPDQRSVENARSHSVQSRILLPDQVDSLLAASDDKIIKNYVNPTKGLIHVIVSGYSLQCLRSARHFCIDASYRHKTSAGFCMLTVVVKNDSGRLMPCAVSLTENERAETVVEVLETIKAAYLERFGEEYTPELAMIDKSASLRLAILTVFPRIRIRLCEFHITQALKRINTEMRADTSNQQRINLNDSQKRAIIAAFQCVQRARDHASFSPLRVQFFVALRQIAPAHYERLQTYFDRNWFSRDWLEAIWDGELIPGLTRNELNTNNYAEACFRVFDQVFLRSLVNKRVDTLSTIIREKMFPYYEFVVFKNRQVCKKLARRCQMGLRLWNDVSHSTSAGVYHVGHHTYNFNTHQCTCRFYLQYGRTCEHFYACDYFILNGPPTQEDLAAIEADGPGSSASDTPDDNDENLPSLDPDMTSAEEPLPESVASPELLDPVVITPLVTAPVVTEPLVTAPVVTAHVVAAPVVTATEQQPVSNNVRSDIFIIIIFRLSEDGQQ